MIPLAESPVSLEKFRDDYVPEVLGAEVRFWFIESDLQSIETAADVAEAESAVAEAVARAEADGCDVAVVACFSEPGLTAAGASARVPVVGEGRVVLAAVGALHERFSVVGASSSTSDAKQAMVDQVGLAGQYAGMVSLDIPVTELTAARAEEMADLLTAEAERGVDAVILGCTGLVPGFTRAVRVALAERGSSIAVIDPPDISGRIAVALAAAQGRQS